MLKPIFVSVVLLTWASAPAFAADNSDMCPAEAPAQGDNCPEHGLTCTYANAVAICLHGQFNVHADF